MGKGRSSYLSKRKCMKRLEARVGFEPTNGGFADLSLGPLGYRAELLSIAKLAQALGIPAAAQAPGSRC
jgi:hypothetical protein